MTHETEPHSTGSDNVEMSRRVLIVGGVAGGASRAAQLRRLDESSEIRSTSPACSRKTS